MFQFVAVLQQHFAAESAPTVCSCIVTVKFCCDKTRLEICSRRVIVTCFSVIVFRLKLKTFYQFFMIERYIEGMPISADVCIRR